MYEVAFASSAFRHQFSAGPLPSGGFEVTIEIPYEAASA